MKHTSVKLEINTPAQMRTGGMDAHWRNGGKAMVCLLLKISALKVLQRENVVNITKKIKS